MKILILVDALVVGGAEKQIISLVNNFDDEYFFTIGYLEKKEDILSQIDIRQQVNTICFNRKKRFDLNVLFQINKLISVENYSIVLCINEYPMLYAYIIKKLWLHNFKLITAIHHTISRPGTWMYFKDVLFRHILNTCDVALFVCKKQMEYWIKNNHTDQKISKFIYNGIDIDYFSPNNSNIVIERSNYNIKDSDIIIGSIATLRPEKKHEDIIFTAKNLIDEGYPIKVLLVGEGPMRNNLQTKSKELGIKDHIIITGFQVDVRPFIAIMDLIIIASDAVETFSIAALEGMSMSKPIVMTNIGGAAEMVKNDINGFLYTPRDIVELTKHIKYIINSKTFHVMGDNSRSLVENNFTLEKMIVEYKKLFECIS